MGGIGVDSFTFTSKAKITELKMDVDLGGIGRKRALPFGDDPCEKRHHFTLEGLATAKHSTGSPLGSAAFHHASLPPVPALQLNHPSSVHQVPPAAQPMESTAVGGWHGSSMIETRSSSTQKWPLQSHSPLKAMAPCQAHSNNGGGPQVNAFDLLRAGAARQAAPAQRPPAQPAVGLQCWVCVRKVLLRDIVQCRYCDRAVCLGCMTPCQSCRQAYCTRCCRPDFSQKYEEYFCPSCNHQGVDNNQHQRQQQMQTSLQQQAAGAPDGMEF